jgi:hypothetical protein
MARYVAWLGKLGTLKASSLKPYLSGVNSFVKDHDLEAIALGDLVAKVRKGLAASQVAIDDTPVRVQLPASIIVEALRMAQALRLQLAAATSREMLQASPARDQVHLLRVCTIMVLLYLLLFSRGGSSIGCLTEDLVASEADGLRLYHRTRKGQREVSAERKLLCRMSPIVHTEVIHMSMFLDTIRHTLSGGKYPIARWAIITLLGATRKVDSQHAHRMAHRDHFGSARTTPRRFRLDLALTTQRGYDSRLQHRRYATKDQTLRWLVHGIQRRLQLHRPDRPCMPM